MEEITNVVHSLLVSDVYRLNFQLLQEDGAHVIFKTLSQCSKVLDLFELDVDQAKLLQGLGLSHVSKFNQIAKLLNAVFAELIV